MGYMEILKLDEEIKPASMDLINRTFNLSLEISRLIDNLRKMYTLEDQDITIEPIELEPVLCDVMDLVRSSHPGKEMVVHEQGCDSGIMVMGNELARDLFINIISNCVKHNHTDVAEIWLNASVEDDMVRIVIEDNGPGIPDSFKQNVFSRWKIETESSYRKGIGMTLVSRIVESYGGKIWVEDRVEGDPSQGLRVVVLLRSG